MLRSTRRSSVQRSEEVFFILSQLKCYAVLFYVEAASALIFINLLKAKSSF